MKNYFLLLFLLVSASHFSFAQKETNHWYFGVLAGMDFSSGSPVDDDKGQLYTNEGCSSISSPAGELLFYTDGLSVWGSRKQDIYIVI